MPKNFKCTIVWWHIGLYRKYMNRLHASSWGHPQFIYMPTTFKIQVARGRYCTCHHYLWPSLRKSVLWRNAIIKNKLYLAVTILLLHTQNQYFRITIVVPSKKNQVLFILCVKQQNNGYSNTIYFLHCVISLRHIFSDWSHFLKSLGGGIMFPAYPFL